jgi:hypothetical protein
VSIALSLRDQNGTKLINADTDAIGFRAALPEGISEWLFRIPHLYLKPGTYQLDLWLSDSTGMVYDRLQPALRITIVDPSTNTVGIRVDPRYDGAVVCDFDVSQAHVHQCAPVATNDAPA